MNRIREFRIGLLGVLALAILCVSCSKNTVANVAEGRGTVTDDNRYMIEKYVVVNDYWLSERLSLENVKTRFVNDLLQVDADLRSGKTKDLRFEHRFRWYDEDDFEIKSGEGVWRPAVVGGKGVVSLQGLAASTQATSFKLEVREPHAVTR